ncbi:MAG: ribokinase [Bacteroidales bacterium]|jgi:ribokinase|nr:ribokinase [Bacteroidota bacterium]NLO00348.1 ribokinase [Bacteroidales bacterium]
MKKILVFGSSNTDMTVKAASLPLPGETVLGGEFTMSPGGKGANQAVAAKRLGGNVSFICKIGRDMFGEDSLRHYREEGIDVSGVLRSDKPSGIALIIVDNGAENSIVVASGANLDIHAADLEASESALRSCDILLLQLEIPVPAVLQAARIANASGATVILNPAPFAALPDEIFRYISLFIPNETELASFSGMPVRDVPTAVAAADVLFAKGVGKMIITMGSKGSLILDGGEPRFIQARRVKAVDTTGAGDTYCGALCVAIAEGKTLPEAAEFASAVSALSVTKMGAQTAMPKRVEAEAFMNQ